MSDTDRRTNLPPLRLHVPEPPFRPGDPVDYSHMEIPAAGALDRLAVDAPAATMREMPYGLIRVLVGEGRVTGPWNPRLAPKRLVAMPRKERKSDETGKVGTVRVDHGGRRTLQK